MAVPAVLAVLAVLARYLYNCAAHKIVSGAGSSRGVSKSDDIIMGISQTCFIN